MGHAGFCALALLKTRVIRAAGYPSPFFLPTLYLLSIITITLGWYFLRNSSIRLQRILLCIVLALAVVTPPFLSTDCYNYIGLGRLLGVFGLSPYEISQAQAGPADPFLSSSHWRNKKSVYGPTLLLAYIPLGWLSELSLKIAGGVLTSIYFLPVLGLKLFLLALHLLNICQINQLASQFSSGTKIPGSTGRWMYGAHPVIVGEGLAEAHHDILLVSLLLLSLRFAARSRTFMSMLTMAALVLTKFWPALLFLGQAIWSVRTKNRRTFVIVCSVSLLLMIAIGILFRYTSILLRAPEITSRLWHSLPELIASWSGIRRVYGIPLTRVLMGISIPAVVLVSWRITRRDISIQALFQVLAAAMIVYCYLANSFLFTWHVIPLAALTALLPRTPLSLLCGTFCLLAPVISMINLLPRWVHKPAVEDTLLAVLFILPLLIGAVAHIVALRSSSPTACQK